MGLPLTHLSERAGNHRGYDPVISSGAEFRFTFAFQPIVDAVTRKIVSCEALVRGPRGESSEEVFAQVPWASLDRFDQACCLKAIRLAKRLHIQTGLSLNLLPNSLRDTGSCIRSALKASVAAGFPPEKLIFEVNEAELMQHYALIEGALAEFQHLGFKTAIDDFGTGYSGLRMLAEYQPNYIKLDRNLIADVHNHRVKQTIVRGIARICRQLSIETIAEGVETAAEYHWLRRAGTRLFQGFYFARPVFEALPEVPPHLF